MKSAHHHRHRVEGNRTAMIQRIIVTTNLAILITVAGSFLGGNALANVGPVNDTPPTQSSATIRVTEPVTLSHYTYLPFAGRDFPPVVHVPQGEYLFVENWTHRVLGAGCESLTIDFPTYHFDPQSGELTIYAPYGPEPDLPLDDGEVGYLGSGTSLDGVGGGANGSLTKIQGLPLSEDNLTLRYVDESGTVTVDRQGDTITLAAGKTWVSDEEIETWDWLGAECVVTSTHYITNHAFQDRDKITFLPD
jgi:hypothetical protein